MPARIDRTGRCSRSGTSRFSHRHTALQTVPRSASTPPRDRLAGTRGCNVARESSGRILRGTAHLGHCSVTDLHLQHMAAGWLRRESQPDTSAPSDAQHIPARRHLVSRAVRYWLCRGAANSPALDAFVKVARLRDLVVSKSRPGRAARSVQGVARGPMTTTRHAGGQTASSQSIRSDRRPTQCQTDLQDTPTRFAPSC